MPPPSSTLSLLRHCAAVLISLCDHVVGVSIDFVEECVAVPIFLCDHVVGISIDIVEDCAVSWSFTTMPFVGSPV